MRTEDEVEQDAADDEQGNEKQSRRPMDPVLRQTAMLDRILDDMPENGRKWALGFLTQKYLAKEAT